MTTPLPRPTHTATPHRNTAELTEVFNLICTEGKLRRERELAAATPAATEAAPTEDAPPAAVAGRKRGRDESAAATPAEVAAADGGEADAAAAFPIKKRVRAILGSCEGGRMKAKRLARRLVSEGVQLGRFADDAAGAAIVEARLAKMEARGALSRADGGKFYVLAAAAAAAGEDAE